MPHSGRTKVMAEQRVCLGVITSAHGVRGQVRIKSFTETPEDLVAYGALSDESGAQTYAVTLTGRSKGTLLAKIDGVTDRDQAEALRGTKLFVAREALPALADQDEFYHADLIGLAAEDTAGRPLGRVRAVHNYGGGDMIELTGPQAPQPGDGPSGSRLLPFTKAVVPLVDLAAGRLVVDPPQETAAEAPRKPGETE